MKKAKLSLLVLVLAIATAPALAQKKETTNPAPVQQIQDSAKKEPPFYLIGDLQAFELLYKAVKNTSAPYRETEPVLQWIEAQISEQIKQRDTTGNGSKPPPKK